MRYSLGYLTALVLISLATVGVALADEPPSVPAAKPAVAGPPASVDAVSAVSAVTEVKPEVFYIRDKDNRLIPVPGFTYDDFVKYYRLKEQLDRPDVKPRYNLEQMTVDGTAEANRADLTVTFKILLLDSEWVRIPLRLNKSALREPATYKGAGDQFIQFEPNGEGYVCWLRGSPRSEHEVTLKYLLPLVATAGENRLELSLPRAAAAKLALHVPVANAAATTSAGNSQPEIAGDPGGSQISVLGVGGDFWLAWRGPDQPASKVSSALEATGLIFSKIDGRSVSSDAALVVRSFGAEFDHFHVRLPPTAQLSGGQQPGYTLTPTANSNGIVEVKLDHKTAGPVEIRLLTERAYDVTKPAESLELAGFAVVEAIPHRQWGHLAVAVSGDWQLVWGDRTRVRQVDELPEGLRRKDLMAGFEYFGQPSSLMVRVVSRKTRVSVEPQYVYRVGAEQIDLEARLKYTIRGARLFKIDLDLPGWEIDSAGPENLVDVNSISSGPGGLAVIPLIQPATGDLELTLKAHRRQAVGIKAVEWTLPEPRVDVLGPAEVTIVPADNIDLTPRLDELVGLSRASGAAPSAELQPAPLYYRAEQAKARFAAGFAVHQQSVTVEMDDQIALGGHQIEVVQVLNYQIRYEPLDRITLEVPRNLFDQRKLKFSIAEEAVEAVEVGEQPSADRRNVQLSLKQPTTGSVRVEVHFLLPQQNLVASSSTAIDLPLVVPADAQLVANSASLTVDPGLRIEQREGPWSVIDPPKNAAGPQAALRLITAESAPELRIALSLDERRALGATFIDRAWIQSWLTETVRQDRAVYNFTSDQDQVRIVLPAGVAPIDVEIILDGRPIAPAAGRAGPLVVNLSSEATRRDHLLQLRYQFDARGPQNGWLSFELPHFDAEVKVRRIYWQLVLPADENLLRASGDLAAEFNWNWRDYGLGLERVPLKEQRQLEQWVGLSAPNNPADATRSAKASISADELPQRTNRYLFSTVGAAPQFEVFVVRRWLLLLAASLGVLLVGLAVIYLPALRQPRVLLAAAIVLFIAVLIWPDPAVLLAQAASLGLGLAVLALVLRRTVSRRDASEMSARGVFSPNLERSSQRVHHRSADNAKAATTTASIPLEVAADDAPELDGDQTGMGPERGVMEQGSGVREL